MQEPVMLLLLMLALVIGLSFLFFQDGAWFELSLGLGLIGLSFVGWYDLADNCVVGVCDEDDPPLLTACWAACGVLLFVGLIGLAAARSGRWPRRPGSTHRRS